MAKRKMLKENKPDDFLSRENFSMAKLTTEILRFGIDKSNLKMRQHRSVILDQQDIMLMEQSMGSQLN